MATVLFNGWVLWHAGTPVALSQTTLTIMLVVLGMALIGFGIGKLSNNKENYQLHRWILTSGLILTVGSILLVMLPAAFRFYTDPDVMVFSSISIVTVVHGIIGFPAVAIGIIFAFGDLPKSVKKWMQRTAAFWILATTSGIVLFLVMMDLL